MFKLAKIAIDGILNTQQPTSKELERKALKDSGNNMTAEAKKEVYGDKFASDSFIQRNPSPIIYSFEKGEDAGIGGGPSSNFKIVLRDKSIHVTRDVFVLDYRDLTTSEVNLVKRLLEEDGEKISKNSRSAYLTLSAFHNNAVAHNKELTKSNEENFQKLIDLANEYNQVNLVKFATGLKGSHRFEVDYEEQDINIFVNDSKYTTFEKFSLFMVSANTFVEIIKMREDLLKQIENAPHKPDVEEWDDNWQD